MTINNELTKNEENIQEGKKYLITHLTSANKLKVYLRIELLDKETEVNCQDIYDYLSEQGIIYGIMHEAITSYCAEKEYSKELVAAVGKAPLCGIDAKLVYDFDNSCDRKFIESEDGTIDFRNLNNVINVTKDTVLCHIIPEQEGENGIDVFGCSINYKKGKTVQFNHGSNTCISTDGLKLLASTDGCVKCKNDCVYIESIYRVNNVDNTTGNIDFIGNIVINGDVKEGFSVTSGGDIKIRGMVEGAFIKAQGDVVISKGMNGMGKGTISAKGNITSKYIENATIFSEKTVYAEALINSEVITKESIILKGSSAAIIGGTSKADNIIYAKTIGSKTNPETNIILDLTSYQEEQKLLLAKMRANSQIDKSLIEKAKELKEIDDKINLILNSSLDNDYKATVQKQLLFMKIRINNEISELNRQKSDIVPKDKIEDHKIICKGTIFSNTRIAIGWMKYRVRQDISYSKLYNDGNDISIVTLNPGDLEL